MNFLFITQSWRSWTGHAFECICLKHIEGIKAELGLAAVQTAASKWKYTPPRGSKEQGCQIDFIIDRADSCINLCETELYSNEFVIDKEYAASLRYKKECFDRITNTKKSTFTTLLCASGVKHNDHFVSTVDQEVTISALFLK